MGYMIRDSRFFVLTGVIWSLAMASLLGVHFFLNKRTSPSRISAEEKSFLNSANDELKSGIKRYETGLIRLKDGKLKLLGTGFEPDEEELVEDKVLIRRQIEIQIDDPVALERKILVGEAFKTLNNSEKICYVERYATIIFREGSYYLYVNSDVYKKYVSKYGTVCVTCEELKKKK